MRRSSPSSQMTPPKVVAAIPCFNTERFIGDIVARAKKYVGQVIVIDDGSLDGTSEAARIAGALVVNHGVNRGVGIATRTCFEAAKANNADILVTLDGDGQHDPCEIPRILKPILNGEVDLVIGSRFLSRQTNIPRYRKFGIYIITWLFNVGSKVKVSDAQSCFRAHSRRLLGALNITESGFGFSVQLLIDARQRGFVITEVPISCVYHSASHTLNPVVHGLGVALTVTRLRLKNSLFGKDKEQ